MSLNDQTTFLAVALIKVCDHVAKAHELIQSQEFWSMEDAKHFEDSDKMGRPCE